MRTHVLSIGVLAVIGTIIVIGAVLTPRFVEEGDFEQDGTTKTALPERQKRCGSDEIVPEGANEYCNRAYHFSLLYPEGLEVRERDEGHGAYTIMFQDGEAQRGFQVFIVPYAGEQISSERFRRDVPSGVRENPVAVTLDDASGAAFYSTDAGLGETYEIWFIYKGWLHEVSTVAPLDTWLQNIMGTWRFLYSFP